MAKSTAGEEVFLKLQHILAKKFKLKEDQIRKNSRLVDDIGVDSVDFWEIITRVEQEFGIDVKDEDVKEVNTIQDVLNILEKKLHLMRS
jgi:acyl carrier protein